MPPSSSLSKRGQAGATTVVRVDMEIYETASSNVYDPIENPEGVFLLNMAENNLSWPLLKEKMESIHKTHPIPDWVSNYTSCSGAPPFRKALAQFMETFLCHCPIQYEHLGVAAGATAIVEISAWILADAGDVAVFPAPCYPVYTQDINNKAQLERYDLITHHEVAEIYHEPPLTLDHLEATLQDIESQGKRFRLLVITNPDNPTGGMYASEKLEQIADWCIEHEVHLVVNEIYGLSLIDTTHPSLKADYPQERTFTSFAQIMHKKESDYLHLWYALSKDLGASGFRVGAVYTLNTGFLAAFNNLAVPHLVSNLTQWVFQVVLEDHDFMKMYIQKNQASLTESYTVVVETLRSFNIPYAPSRGSLFVWVDFSELLDAPTAKAENKFWLQLYETTGLLITPSNGFGHSKKGQFRLVYPGISKSNLIVAMKRLEKYIQSKREPSKSTSTNTTKSRGGNFGKNK